VSRFKTWAIQAIVSAIILALMFGLIFGIRGRLLIALPITTALVIATVGWLRNSGQQSSHG
jgi:hypothetical protein